jgi:nitrate reductase (cytochrome), electron transfer subunit
MKPARILIITGLMAAGVFVAGGMLTRGSATAVYHPRPAPEPPLATESGMFRMASKALGFTRAVPEKNSKRTMKVFEERRAYPGAPPFIPHPLLEDKTMGGRNCLGCHTDGGYVEPLKAYAPITPHPELGNCRQCHVAQPDKGLFRANTFHKIPGPAIDLEALPGGPPPIPHTLTMRENCLACHGGPGAVAEIRTPHPDRVNCRQCHAESARPAQAFQRGLQ